MIDFTSTLVGMVGCFFGVLLIIPVSRFFKIKKESKLFLYLMSIFGVLGFGLGSTLSQVWLFPPFSLHRLIKEGIVPIKDHPRLEKMMEELPEEEAKLIGAKLVTAGLKRLDSQHLLQRLAFYQSWAESSDLDVCSGMFSGMDHATFLNLVTSLPRDQLKVWWDISVMAMKLELDEAPARQITAEDTQDAIKLLFRVIGEEKGQRLRKNFEAGKDKQELSKAEKCWSARIIYNAIPDIEEPQRTILALLFMQPANQ